MMELFGLTAENALSYVYTPEICFGGLTQFWVLSSLSKKVSVWMMIFISMQENINPEDKSQS